MVFNSSTDPVTGIPLRLKIILLFLAAVLSGEGVRAGDPLKNIIVQSFSDTLIKSGFKPSLLETGPAGWEYYLDLNTRRIALKQNTGRIIFTGGFGREMDALFDPVDHAVFDLFYFVCDRSDNRVLRFDQQLNYINQIVTKLPDSQTPLYPDMMALDPWGQIYVYSRNFHTIYKYEGQNFQPFLDLNRESFALNCLSEFQFDEKGNIMLLYTCKNELHLYNRVGRLIRRYILEIEEPAKLIYTRLGWIILNKNGTGQILKNNQKFSISLNINEIIMDAAVFNQELVVLTSQNVLKLIFQTDN